MSKSRRLQAFLGGIAAIGEGMASIGGGLFPPRPRRRIRTDAEAIADDWQHTGDNLRRAMGSPSQEQMDAMQERLMRRVREAKAEQENKEE